MAIRIFVGSTDSETDLGLAKLIFRHENCQWPRMQSNRVQGTDIWRLICSCGVEVTFPQLGTAANTILFTYIDECARTLAFESCQANSTDAVQIDTLKSKG
jgi:hypothetical protein